MNVTITIIGAGVIGSAVAYELSKDKEIFVLEKNKNLISDNQSARNSGVIHSGIYYPKKYMSKKANFCVKGNNTLTRFCDINSIPYKTTGKLIVATNTKEDLFLDELLINSKNNEINGVKKIGKDAIQSYEPNVTGISALFVPTTGIIDVISYLDKLHSKVKNNGSHILAGNNVIEINPLKNGFEIRSVSNGNVETFATKYIINAGGLYSDEIASLVNPKNTHKINPLKGEWAKFYATKDNLKMNKLNVYPTPYGINKKGEKISYSNMDSLLLDPSTKKTLGIHLTPTFDFTNNDYNVSDTIIIGPSSKQCVSKEDYKPTRNESHYLESIHSFFPNLTIDDILLHQTGIQASLQNNPDFVIEKDTEYPNLINLIGIDSPGLTSSLAIAEYVKDLLYEKQ